MRRRPQYQTASMVFQKDGLFFEMKVSGLPFSEYQGERPHGSIVHGVEDVDILEVIDEDGNVLPLEKWPYTEAEIHQKYSMDIAMAILDIAIERRVAVQEIESERLYDIKRGR